MVHSVNMCNSDIMQSTAIESLVSIAAATTTEIATSQDQQLQWLAVAILELLSSDDTGPGFTCSGLVC